MLEDSITAYQLNHSRIPLNTFAGFFTWVLNISNGIAMNSVTDYQDYIQSLREVPRYFSEHIDNMCEGVASNFTLPKIVIKGVLTTLEAQLLDDPTASSLYMPFFRNEQQAFKKSTTPATRKRTENTERNHY